MEQTTCEKTRVAVLGIFADLGEGANRDDLRWLERLVQKIEPDLLCAAIRRDHWEKGHRDTLELEYREVLVPLAERTNIVIVPVSGTTLQEPTTRYRSALWHLCGTVFCKMNAGLQRLQHLTNISDTIIAQAYGWLCDVAFECGALACGGASEKHWSAADQEVIDNLLRAVRRDPGRRVLVTVDSRRYYSLTRRLRQISEVELVDFWKL